MTNHLWQSTLFAAVAGPLAVALRKNRAHVRYWLWLSASLKFLVPFALLMSLGSQLEWTPAAQTMATPVLVIEQIAQPFPETVPLVQSTPDRTDWIPFALLSVWLCGFAAIALIRCRGWLRIRAAVRSSKPVRHAFACRLQVRSSPGLLEPGVVGLWNPILLLPAGIEKHLTPSQLEAVLAHELCHVRRRDNLFASIHMIVEAVFWFHPLVWWIGSRLVEERERACDEEVLSLGNEPRVYAEGILNVCKLYVESPLTCMSGVTGADIKKRIEAIMINSRTLNLNFAKKATLAVAGLVAVALPIVVGLTHAQAIPAQATAAPLRFEVATVKPTITWKPAVTFPSPGRFSLGGDSLKALIRYAYDAGLGSNKEVTGGPGWIDKDFYNVEAKAEGSPTVADYQLMLRTLLAERFALKVHTVPKTVDVYALVLARSDGKLGPGVQPFPGQCGALRMPSSTAPKQLAPKQPAGDPPYRPLTAATVPPLGCNISFGGRGGIRLEGAPMAFLARMLSTQSAILGRPVVDRTGLTDRYNIQVALEFPPLARPNGENQPADVFAPSLFAALQNQLGVKLESSKGTVENIVVDSAERPTEN